MALAGFVGLWIAGLLGAYVVAVGTVVGTVAIAVSSISAEHIRDKWIVAGLGTALVGACAALDTAEQLHAVKLKNALESEIQEYATRPTNKTEFLGFLDSRLHDCLNRPSVDVDHCADLETLLEHINPAHGGVPYYTGEILRYRGRVRDSDDSFYNYLEAESRVLPRDQRDNGSASVCNTNGIGFCDQRTSWVCHTLANDLFRRGCDAGDPNQRLDFFVRAQEQLKCEQKHFTGGFEQRLGTRPMTTTDLAVALKPQLNDPARKCDAPPPRF
ncbi:MAG TPA: hypothetical protein VE397_17110 [Stellaceae bacterium]|nr:hypothetical protein [Stellaceae bacterium]